MKIEKAERVHFKQICNLITSPEEMYVMCPGGKFPLDLEQMDHVNTLRRDLSIVKVNNQIVGFANLYNIKSNESAFIGNLIIDKSQRGNGYGMALVKHMIEIIKVKYNAVPHLSVLGNNTKAILLYKAIGFLPYDVEERIDYKGHKVALFHMRYEK